MPPELRPQHTDAARAAGADVLLTGDTTHVGPLMARDDLGLRVRTPRAFLLEGPG